MRLETMSDPTTDPAMPKPGTPRTGRLAIVLAILALALSAAQWYVTTSRLSAEHGRAEMLATTQQRMRTLESRIERERADLDRMAQNIGRTTGGAGPLAERIAHLEQEFSQQKAGADARREWLIDQAGHFLRIANAQETLAGNTTGALGALSIADQYLREAADPRLAVVRKRIADETAALRALPVVDLEGMVLKLGTLSDTLEKLPQRQQAPGAFTAPAVALPEAPPTATERAKQTFINALRGILSLRRTDEPSATLLSEQATQLLMRSLDLELQLARLALLRGEVSAYRAALANVGSELQRYFDADAAEVVAAQALLTELSGAPLPDQLPDISGSLTELLRIRSGEPAP